MYHNYGNLKVHFDRLLTTPAVPSNAVDPIRSLYHAAFNRKISLFDVYRTHLNMNHNPVKNIVTLLGQDGNPVYTGVMMDYNGLVYINSFTEDILKPMDRDIAKNYVYQIVKDMDVIVGQDPLYKDLKFAKKNPYSMVLRVIPIYVAFHHIGCCAPYILDYGIFEELLTDKKIAKSDNGIELMLDSMVHGKYSDEPWTIYNAVSCNNTINLFEGISKDIELD